VANLNSQVHTIARPDLFNSTKKLVTEAIRQSGFQWEDVASIIPAPNFVGEMTREGVFDSGRFDTAFVTNTERSLDVSGTPGLLGLALPVAILTAW
jgi:hypothetical protein